MLDFAIAGSGVFFVFLHKFLNFDTYYDYTQLSKEEAYEKNPNFIRFKFSFCFFHCFYTGTGRAIGNAVQDTAQGARNMVEGSTHKVESEARSATDNNRNDGYTATQTSTRAAAEPTVFGMNATMWTWMIVILTAIGIGSLIWFYNSAKADIHRSNH